MMENIQPGIWFLLFVLGDIMYPQSFLKSRQWTVWLWGEVSRVTMAVLLDGVLPAARGCGPGHSSQVTPVIPAALGLLWTDKPSLSGKMGAMVEWMPQRQTWKTLYNLFSLQ